MDKSNKKVLKYVLIGIVVIAILWWAFKPGKEHLSHRLTSVYDLGPMTGSTAMNQTAYSQPWDFQLSQGATLPQNYRENYSDMYMCERACANVLGDSPRDDCINQCMNATLINNQSITPPECGNGYGINKVCVTPGFYNTADTACLESLEPGVTTPSSLTPGMRHLSYPLGNLTPALVHVDPALTPLTRSLVPVSRGWTPLTPSWVPLGGNLAPIKRNPILASGVTSCKAGEFFNSACNQCQKRLQI